MPVALYEVSKILNRMMSQSKKGVRRFVNQHHMITVIMVMVTGYATYLWEAQCCKEIPVLLLSFEGHYAQSNFGVGPDCYKLQIPGHDQYKMVQIVLVGSLQEGSLILLTLILKKQLQMFQAVLPMQAP
jgi:hypothetical protein